MQYNDGIGSCYIPEDYAARFHILEGLGNKNYAFQRVRYSSEIYIS